MTHLTISLFPHISEDQCLGFLTFSHHLKKSCSSVFLTYHTNEQASLSSNVCYQLQFPTLFTDVFPMSL
uniref:Uncharacterized protein n=1 Tax=Anguilla anguilla TaxID=7936 RepID=A0A0E9TEX6_ANGAN